MAIVVIGGQTRNIGKTSVVCALISAMPERHWTAIKITQCKHGNGSPEVQPCDCELDGQTSAISEERDSTSGTDSSRYLVAGAARSFWVRTRRGNLGEAMPRIQAIISSAQNVIFESNSILDFLQPDLYASVLDPAVVDFKDSALRCMQRADAVLLPEGTEQAPAWNEVSIKLIERIPKFQIVSPNYCSLEFVAFVAQQLDRVRGTK